jgi:hypothetical protein
MIEVKVALTLYEKLANQLFCGDGIAFTVAQADR